MRLLLIFSLLFSSNYSHYQIVSNEKLDQYFNLIESKDKAMGTVAIIKEGDIIYQRSFGYSNKSEEKKANPETIYRIGSISKTYTATLIMKLQEAGKLKLDDKLSKYFPVFKNGGQITLEMMLNHTSGLHNFTDDPDYFGIMYTEMPREKLVSHIVSKGMDFEPGSSFSYSNSNYVLLGYIIEDVSGMSYNEFLQKEILLPLKLSHTRYGEAINVYANEAKSYFPMNGEWTPSPETNMSVPHGAGAIVSTALDVAAFADNLFKGNIVSQESLEAMMPKQNNYGLAITPYPYRGYEAYGHSGGIDGFHTQVIYFPKEDISVAYILNGLNYNKGDLIAQSLDLLFEHTTEIPNVDGLKLGEEQLSKCEGDYFCEALGLGIKVWIKGGELVARATGQNSFTLTAIANNKFKFDAASLKMEFTEEKEGKYQSFTLFQGAEFKFSRTK